MSAKPVEYLLTAANIATMAGNGYGLIENGAVGISQGKIAWVGKAGDAPEADRVEDCRGQLITPALIDCHTHLVHGGNRAAEFEQRLEGVSYEEIARQGGGISSTMRATRAASEGELLELAIARLDCLLAQGVATVEIKSGYGLDRENELKMLRVARQLEHERQVRVKTTFLGAHALPPEFSGRSDDYISFVCDDILPAAHAEGLVDAVDGYAEKIAFSPRQIARVFDKARELGIAVKLHAEQLSNMGAAAMAARAGAMSVDHLEYLAAEDVAVLAQHGTVAVLLPGAFYFLRETQLPPVDALRAAGVPLVVATDANPGSSPLYSLLLAMNMACTLFGLTPQEAFAGCTRVAAQALGLQDCIGTIETGKIADIAIWQVKQPVELLYNMGCNPLVRRMFGGKWK